MAGQLWPAFQYKSGNMFKIYINLNEFFFEIDFEN